jgi:predicted ester cyclase
MTSEAGSTEANAILVRESVNAFNAGDTNKLLTIAAPDIVTHYAEMPEPLQGRETWQQGYELVKRAFPDLKIRVDDLVAAEDKGEFQSIPATGRTVTYVSYEFYRVADGQVAEEWICSDMASLFSQLS